VKRRSSGLLLAWLVGSAGAAEPLALRYSERLSLPPTAPAAVAPQTSAPVH